MGKTVCPTSQWKKMSACFRAGRESLMTKLGKHCHQGWYRLREKWLSCHIAKVFSKGGCQYWNNVDNITRQIALSESVARIVFQSNSLTSKRNWVWGSHFNICFDIMKTPLSWSVSRLDVYIFSMSVLTFKVHYFLNSSSTEEPSSHSISVQASNTNVCQVTIIDFFEKN